MDKLISQQAAIDALKDLTANGTNKGMVFGEDAVHRIEMLPSAQPERKIGTWTKDASCPFCGFQPWYERDIHTLSFCPNCGADMRGDKHETD